MDEKEIEKEIYRHVVASVIPCDKDFDPEEDGFPFSVSVIGVIKAARAIHERMQEDVVWEGGAVVRHEDKWEDGDLIITASLHFDELPPGWLLNVGDSKRVIVTVRRAKCNESTNQDSGEEL